MGEKRQCTVATGRAPGTFDPPTTTAAERKEHVEPLQQRRHRAGESVRNCWIRICSQAGRYVSGRPHGCLWRQTRVRLLRTAARGSTQTHPQPARSCWNLKTGRSSVNFSLVGEVLRDNHDDFHDRMADLSDVVPDFPIDPTEFRDFWNGFCMVANGLPFASDLSRPRRKRPSKPSGSDPQPVPSGEDEPLAKAAEMADDPTSPVETLGRQVDQPVPLEMVDFYWPQISKDGNFRLLPATTIILGKRSGHVLLCLARTGSDDAAFPRRHGLFRGLRHGNRAVRHAP